MTEQLPDGADEPVLSKLRELGRTHALPRWLRRCLLLARGGVGSRWFKDPRNGRWRLIDPFIENVPEALASWCADNGWRLTVFIDGPPPDYAPPERPRYSERYPGIVDEIYATELTSLFPGRAAVRSSFEAFYPETLFADGGFQDVFSYRGVRFFDTMADQMRALPRLGSGFVHNRQQWFKIFEALRPEVIFGGRLEVRADVNAAAHALGIRTVSVKLGISEEMLTPFAIADAQGDFYSEIFPDVLAVWGESQKALIESRFPKCTSHIVASGRTRNDTFAGAPSHFDDAPLREFLKIGPTQRIIVYGANIRTKYGQVADRNFGTCCMSPESYRRGLDELLSVSKALGDTVVVVKPHPSDDIPYIRSVVQAIDSAELRFLTDADGFHNATLLHASDVFVSSVSSMFAEAVLSDCAPVNLWTQDIAYLYEQERRDLYGTISRTVDRFEDLGLEVRRMLTDEDYRRSEIARASAALEPIFGRFDGRNAQRLVKESFAALNIPPRTAAAEAETSASSG